MRDINSVILIGVMLITTSLVGCAHGNRTEHFPLGLDAESSAEVFVLRNKNVFGMAVSKRVLLDGWVIATVGPGQFVRFRVEPGSHSVGGAEGSAALEFSAGEEYYFLLTPAGFTDNFELERLKKEEALPLIEDYKEIKK